MKIGQIESLFIFLLEKNAVTISLDLSPEKPCGNSTVIKKITGNAGFIGSTAHVSPADNRKADDRY